MPYELQFEVNDPFRMQFDSVKEIGADGSQVSWMDQMARIASGSDLMTVYALTSPTGVTGSAGTAENDRALGTAALPLITSD